MAVGEKKPVAMAVENPTAGNLAELMSDGQIRDSGKNITDFAPAPLKNNLILYVDALTGNDANNGTSGFPFKTIQAAVNSVPKDLGGYSVRILVSPGVYPENVFISGFYNSTGYNAFILQGSDQNVATTTHQINSITIQGTIGLFIQVNGFNITGNSGTAIAVNSGCISLSSCNLTGPGSGYGITIGDYGSCTAFVRNCTIDGYDYGLSVQNQGIVSTYASQIKNCSIGIRNAGSGNGSVGIVFAAGITFSGNSTDIMVAYGGQVLNTRNDFAG